MKRILLKLSGEALGERAFSSEKTQFLVSEIQQARKSDVQIAIVIGGGNIWRGRDSAEFGLASTDSDAIGMTATVLNAAVLKRSLEKSGASVRIFSPYPCMNLTEIHSPDAEISALESGDIVIFAGGTGNPFFTTDSAAVLRALEIRADAVFKGTKVSGVYDSNPEINPDAKKLENLTYSDALHQGLQIMDATAFALAQEKNLPLFIFNAFEKGNISGAIAGSVTGSWVRN